MKKAGEQELDCKKLVTSGQENNHESVNPNGYIGVAFFQKKGNLGVRKNTKSRGCQGEMGSR